MAKKKKQSFRIENVEGLTSLEIDLEPGVNVLQGRNGAGKTSAIKAVTAAAGGKSVKPHDTAERGSIVGPGVRLTVGGNMRRNGTPHVALADIDTIDELLDPPVKAPAARTKRRLKALAKLVDVRVTEDELLELTKQNAVDAPIEMQVAIGEEVVGSVQGKLGGAAELPLFEAQTALADFAMAIARDHEAKAEQAKGKATAARDRLSRFDDTDEPAVTDIEKIDELIRNAQRDVDRLEGAADQAEKTRVSAEEARTKLAQLGDIEALRAKARELMATVEDLESKLVAVREELAIVRAKGQAAKELQDVLDAADVPSNGDDVKIARAALENLEMQRAAAWDWREISSAQNALNEADDEFADEDTRGKLARAIAVAVQENTSKLLAAKGLPEFEITDQGVLLAPNPDTGEMMPVDKLSDGQRTALVLRDIVAANIGSCTLPLSPAYWNDLQPARQKELSELAREHGIFIVTEEATDDDDISVRNV